MAIKKIPQIKFYKDAVPDILSGKKTLEPRPRSPRWIEKITNSKEAELTYGPRIGVPTVFAKAEILEVETRPFETATREDLDQVALGWEDKEPYEFVDEYTKWFSKDLAKGNPVAWIRFKVKEKYE